MKKFLHCTVKCPCIGNRRNAFTLAEVLVVVGIASLFSFLVFRFYFQANRSQTLLLDGLQMQTAVVTGVNKVLREVRNGRGFLVPSLNEKSTILAFSDFENNVVSVFPLKNAQMTKEEGEDIYDVYCYKTDAKSYSGGSSHNSKNLRHLCSHVKDISFQLANSNSVTISFTFMKSGKVFQTISEGPLMNSGDVL